MRGIDTVHAVGCGVGQKADRFNFVVHAPLKKRVKPGTFRLDLSEVGKLGAELTTYECEL